MMYYFFQWWCSMAMLNKQRAYIQKNTDKWYCSHTGCVSVISRWFHLLGVFPLGILDIAALNNVDRLNRRTYTVNNMLDWLVVWNIFLFFHILGMSSSQLTNSYFSEGVEPPTRFQILSRVFQWSIKLRRIHGHCHWSSLFKAFAPVPGPLLERHCRTAMVVPVRTGNRAEFLNSAGQKLRCDYKTMMIMMGMYQKQFLLSCHHHHFTWNKRTVFLLQFLNHAMLAGENIFDPSLLEKYGLNHVFFRDQMAARVFFICEVGAWCPLPGPLFGVKFQIYRHDNPVKYKCRIWTPWPMAFIENNIEQLTDTMPA